MRMATEAVLNSWNGKRAFDYRSAGGIAHDLGTAVNIITMVFGNMGEGSGTGVVTTRNVCELLAVSGADRPPGSSPRGPEG
jgi:pyruvate,orthophosphate dikinase